MLLSPVLLSQTRPASEPTSEPSTSAQKVVLVASFENVSKAPGIQWIGESFPEVIGQRLGGTGLRVMSRTERVHALDNAGVPVGVHPSRATMFRVADQTDVDFVVLGSYDFDGHLFTATCQRLDIKRAHLSKKMVESGPLTKLIDIQTALAWDLLRLDDAALTTSRDGYIAAAPPIRLDSLENYTRGVTATSAPDRIRYFHEALRINPEYSDAQFALGEAEFENKQYEIAAGALMKVPPAHPSFTQAQFLLGLCALNLGQFEKSESAFSDLATRLPLPEVYNNLGVARARRGQPSSLEMFQKAANADPEDSDYRFNLAVAMCRKGDTIGCTRELRTFLASNPNDAEAKGLLESLIAASDPKFAANAPALKVPPERVKPSYDETAKEDDSKP
jgi:thioredoxin-like negative regulator of GroEL/TolB-like protein